MNTALKIIGGLIIIVILGIGFWASRNQNKIENPITDPIVEELPEETDPVFMVRVILANATVYNQENTWQRGDMSEPTLIEEILETEEAWDYAYTEFQSLLKLSNSEMQNFWTELTSEKSVGEWEAVVAEFVENQETGENLMTVEIPLSSAVSFGDIGPIGCGSYLNFHPIQVPESTGVLQAVYSKLFELPHIVNENISDTNSIASQQNLDFASVSIVDGMVKLYLTGQIMGNHCEDPVFRAQIEEAAFQYDTVDAITVYVNNQIFNWCSISDADPSEDGCNANPKLWVTQKQN